MALTNLELYAIQPAERTNLILNPSIELATTGFGDTNGSNARVVTQQRRGLASLELTPDTGVISNLYYSLALTNGTAYTFSVDVLDVVGQTMTLIVGGAVGGAIATGTAWTGDGHWKRKSLSFTANADTPFSLIVQRSAIASTAKIYTDGWQLEAGAVSSYLDGDMRGFVRGQTDYYWNGTPHASTSFRSGQTRSGGTEVRLKDYMTIMTILGLGMSPVINNALPNIRGGAFYQNSVFDSRVITVGGAINGTTPGAILTNRKALLNAINPRQTQTEQPMILRIKGLDSAGVEQAETVDAVVQYSGGMEGDFKSYAEMVGIQFQVFLPYLANEAEVGTAITINQTVANTDYIAYRSKAGAWAAMTTGTNATVNAIAIGLDGSVYVGGNFTLAGGIANTAYIAKWNGTAWTALGTGTSAAVKALAIGPDGSLYVGGAFTNLGDANGDYIAKWNGSAWSSLGTGMNTGTVEALAVGLDGTVYAGGTFTLAGGVANTVYIAKWNGTAWSALGTGMNGAVYALEVDPAGSLYAGGAFTLAGGVANTIRIAKWNGTAWTALSTGMADNTVLDLRIGPDGALYAGGSFSLASGITNTVYIAKWNGTAWSALGTGMNGQVSALRFSSDGNLYAGGAFTLAGGVTVPYGLAVWNGSSWVSPDISPPAGPILALSFDVGGGLYIGYSLNGSSTTPLIQTVTNSNAYPVYPKITFTGPGTLYQIKNTTTGKTIYFNYTLLAGESAVLDLDPNNLKFTSTFRGNVINTILPGSQLDLQLITGANSISCFIAGTTSAATACQIVWKPLYNNYDGAIY